MIPKSNSLDRIKENYESMSFKLTQEEVDQITTIDEGFRICDNYAWIFNNSIFA